ncbi:hypothetical protein FACS189434_09610 [Bacteroidia bacterium]|nr:hypothetical protein FACS189434_09610 [Bacteroidia bacterium]
MKNFTLLKKIICIAIGMMLSAVVMAEDPQIIITHIPQIGTGGSAKGRIEWSELSASNTGNYAVIAMLSASWGDYYVKPTNDSYLNTIDKDGKFSINITTGGSNDYGIADVLFYFVKCETFTDVSGSTVKAGNMNGKYLCSLKIDRNDFVAVASETTTITDKPLLERENNFNVLFAVIILVVIILCICIGLLILWFVLKHHNNNTKQKQEKREQEEQQQDNKSAVVSPNISSLEIDKDYKIILQDYGQITMTPKDKTVFILFLKHKEGIVLKNISDYKDELKAIYMILSSTVKDEKIDKTIKNICEQNSLNESITRIKRAFTNKIPETTIAEKYFITGGRGEEKKITLDRDATFPEDIERIPKTIIKCEI